LTGADRRQQRLRAVGVFEVAFGAQLFEDAERFVEMPFRDGPGARFGHEPSEREMAEG
jgi:hypothetical protein